MVVLACWTTVTRSSTFVFPMSIQTMALVLRAMAISVVMTAWFAKCALVISMIATINADCRGSTYTSAQLLLACFVL